MDRVELILTCCACQLFSQSTLLRWKILLVYYFTSYAQLFWSLQLPSYVLIVQSVHMLDFSIEFLILDVRVVMNQPNSCAILPLPRQWPIALPFFKWTFSILTLCTFFYPQAFPSLDRVSQMHYVYIYSLLKSLKEFSSHYSLPVTDHFRAQQMLNGFFILLSLLLPTEFQFFSSSILSQISLELPQLSCRWYLSHYFKFFVALWSSSLPEWCFLLQDEIIGLLDGPLRHCSIQETLSCFHI